MSGIINHTDNQTINIIISDTSLTNTSFKEAIDLALVCAAFEQIVNIIFVDNGVYNIIQNQNYNMLGDKNHIDILKGLEFYDIENIYVEQESFDNRNLNTKNMLDGCELISINEIKMLHLKSNHLVNF